MSTAPVGKELDTPVSEALPAPCRIWVLEDHDAIRQLLAQFVLVKPTYTVVGASARASDLIEACRRGEVDLVLLDLVLDGVGGLQVLEELATLTPRPKAVVFSGTATLHTVQAALSLGVSAYVDKSASLDQLRVAIARAAEGGVYFSERVSTIMRRLVEQRNAGSGGSHVLTSRELRVLELIARGFSAKELAAEVGLSEPAIYKIKQSISTKLQAWTDQQLTLNALRMGLIGALDEDPRPRR